MKSPPKSEINDKLGSPRLGSPRMTRGLNLSIALVLFLAGSFKLYQLATNPFFAFQLQIPNIVIWMAVFVELGIAYWNIKANPEPFLWLVNLSFFVLLGSISLARWMMGFEECGCFGWLHVSPFQMMCFDFDSSKLEKAVKSVRKKYYDEVKKLFQTAAKETMSLLTDDARENFKSNYGEFYDYRSEVASRWNSFASQN